MRRRSRSGHLFSAEYVAADCTKKRLRELYRDPEQTFDLVSSQFTFHYCFESLPQAECMLRNISENLRYGGFFIGTTPDAYDIVSRLEKSGTNRVAIQAIPENIPNGTIVDILIQLEWFS